MWGMSQGATEPITQKLMYPAEVNTSNIYGVEGILQKLKTRSLYVLDTPSTIAALYTLVVFILCGYSSSGTPYKHLSIKSYWVNSSLQLYHIHSGYQTLLDNLTPPPLPTKIHWQFIRPLLDTVLCQNLTYTRFRTFLPTYHVITYVARQDTLGHYSTIAAQIYCQESGSAGYPETL